MEKRGVVDEQTPAQEMEPRTKQGGDVTAQDTADAQEAGPMQRLTDAAQKLQRQRASKDA